MIKSSIKITKQSARAFAPGHISGFFQPLYDKKNILLTGSRGAGISVSLGCHSQVTVKKDSRQHIEVFTGKQQSKSAVVHRCLNYLLKDSALHVLVNSSCELPIGQGFGMSAAASLAAGYAVADCLQIPLKNALVAAHRAEVELQTGLGDVIGAFAGGIEIRKHPGIALENVIQHIPGSFDMVLCIIDNPIDTKQILNDETRIDNITKLGKYCTDSLLKHPTIEEFFSLSLYFTKQSGLASDVMLQAIDEAEQYGLASMCMLGNAVFAMGETDKLISVLNKYGMVFQTSIDKNGARIINEK